MKKVHEDGRPGERRGIVHAALQFAGAGRRPPVDPLQRVADLEVLGAGVVRYLNPPALLCWVSGSLGSGFAVANNNQ